MNALLYFLLIAAFFFLMMRFGCGSHVMGHGHGGGHENEPPGNRVATSTTEVDPVCGKTVRAAEAKTSVYEGTVYYFCSRECRERFEAAPRTYLAHEHAGRSSDVRH